MPKTHSIGAPASSYAHSSHTLEATIPTMAVLSWASIDAIPQIDRYCVWKDEEDRSATTGVSSAASGFGVISENAIQTHAHIPSTPSIEHADVIVMPLQPCSGPVMTRQSPPIDRTIIIEWEGPPACWSIGRSV